LIQSGIQDFNPPANPISTAKDQRLKTILLLFSLFVVSDFVLGYIKERSIPAGVISIFGGLFSTAFYLLLFWWGSRKDKGDSGS
jgi:hypothetical protein